MRIAQAVLFLEVMCAILWIF